MAELWVGVSNVAAAGSSAITSVAHFSNLSLAIFCDAEPQAGSDLTQDTLAGWLVGTKAGIRIQI